MFNICTEILFGAILVIKRPANFVRRYDFVFYHTRKFQLSLDELVFATHKTFQKLNFNGIGYARLANKVSIEALCIDVLPIANLTYSSKWVLLGFRLIRTSYRSSPSARIAMVTEMSENAWMFFFAAEDAPFWSRRWIWRRRWFEILRSSMKFSQRPCRNGWRATIS